MNHLQSQRLKVLWLVLQGVGLLAIATSTFSIISSLLFGVLGLAPSSPDWHLALLVAFVFSLAGAAVGIQTFKTPYFRQMGIISGITTGAILGFYNAGQFNQEAALAIGGAIVGSLLGGVLAVWTYRPQPGRAQHLIGVAIAIVSTFCAYGAAFGLGAWTLMALSTYHWGLALVLALPTGLYLWLTQRSLTWTYRQWRQGWRAS